MKLLVLMALTTLVVAELELFPDEGGQRGAVYDESRMNAWFFGARTRRDADSSEGDDDCGDSTQDIWGFELGGLMGRPGRRGGHGGPGGPPRGGPPGGGPPEGEDGGPDGPPPPPPEEGNTTAEARCPPEPREGGPGGPPGGGPPPGGPPPGGRPHGGPPPPRRGGKPRCKRPMHKLCCNSSLISEEIVKYKKECRTQVVDASKSNGGQQANRCAPWFNRNITDCVFEKFSWAKKTDGKMIISDATAIKEKLGALMQEKYPEWGTKFGEIIETCQGKEGSNGIREFIRCVKKARIVECPAAYWSSECNESCGKWKTKLQNEQQ